MRPRWLALAGVLAALLGVAGCGRSGTEVAAGNRMQVLHRGIGPDLTDLDPQLATQAADFNVLSALLEGLVSEDPVDLHPVPGVAESWKVSDDGLTYTFYLRANAKWSNGRAVTAQDFIGSWKRMLSPKLGASNASQLYLIQGAEAFNRGDTEFSQVGLHSSDPRVLTVTLEHAAPWFLSELSGLAWLPVPLPTIEKYGPLDQRGNAWSTTQHWVGNGAFVPVSWRRGQQIVVARSPTYWDHENVRLTEIHFHTFDSVDAEERSFRSGQLHVTDALPPGKLESYRKLSPSPLRIDPLLGTYFLRLNVRRPGLGDARIRLALGLAVDRATLVDRVLRGGQAPADAFTPPGIGAYTPPPVQRHRLDEARKLLADAGHAGGEGLPELDLLYNSSENHKLIAEAIQEMWRRDLGIRVRLVNEDQKSTEEARRAGTYDLLRSSWIADYSDPSSFLDVFRGDSSNNFTGWSNADYDTMLFRAARTQEPNARDALFERAERLLLTEAPVIPLFHYTHVFLIQPSVHGWYPTILDHHPYKAVSLGD